MSSIRIATRYAKSLLDLATDSNKLDIIKGDLETFIAATENRDLFLLIKSPIIKADKKLKVFKAIFGDKVDELTSAFFEIVIKKGREELLPEIAASFQDQYNGLNNITAATITTATKVSGQVIDEIKANMNGLGINVANVVISEKIDPSILGGYILEVGDKLLDASVKASLAKVKEEIVDNSYIKTL